MKLIILLFAIAIALLSSVVRVNASKWEAENGQNIKYECSGDYLAAKRTGFSYERAESPWWTPQGRQIKEKGYNREYMSLDTRIEQNSGYDWLANALPVAEERIQDKTIDGPFRTQQEYVNLDKENEQNRKFGQSANDGPAAAKMPKSKSSESPLFEQEVEERRAENYPVEHTSLDAEIEQSIEYDQSANDAHVAIEMADHEVSGRPLDVQGVLKGWNKTGEDKAYIQRISRLVIASLIIGTLGVAVIIGAMARQYLKKWESEKEIHDIEAVPSKLENRSEEDLSDGNDDIIDYGRAASKKHEIESPHINCRI